MQQGQWEVHISDVPGTRGKKLFFICQAFDGKTEVLQPDFNTIITVNHGVPAEPTIKFIDQNMLQALMGAGFKPSEASYTQGKLEATYAHLNDLRTILKLTNKN